MSSPVRTFLSKFSNDKKFLIPISSLWTVTFADTNVVGEINKALQKVSTYSGWRASPSSTWLDSSLGNILVAQDVTLPQDSFEAVEIGVTGSYANYIPGYGINKRTSFLSRNVTVNFMETRFDIESGLFRPWVIALSIDGLMNQGLKATNMKVTQYDEKLSPRKIYTFYDVFPTNTEGGTTLNYADDQIISKTVTFAYRDYKVELK